MHRDRRPLNPELVEMVTAGDALLDKARRVAEKVKESVWRATQAHVPRPPRVRKAPADRQRPQRG